MKSRQLLVVETAVGPEDNLQSQFNLEPPHSFHRLNSEVAGVDDPRFRRWLGAALQSPSRFRLRPVSRTLVGFYQAFESKVKKRTPISRMRKVLSPLLRSYAPLDCQDFLQRSYQIAEEPIIFSHLRRSSDGKLSLSGDYATISKVNRDFRSQLRSSQRTYDDLCQRTIEISSSASFNPDF